MPTVQCYAEIYNLMGEKQLAKAYYDSARVLIETEIEKSPNESYLHSAVGIVYAGLGRRAEAVREGELAVDLLPISREAISGYLLARDLAKIYAMVGEYDEAIDQLEYLLSIPGNLSAQRLRLDPVWAPLKDHPRFQRLLAKYASVND
jgi:serine/threonine-protein kinase